MPTTYTHDLFGKEVYKQLPKDIKKIIRRYGNLYRIGLHGPDILFYNMPKVSIPKIGVRMHDEDAAAFFERSMTLVRTRNDKKLLAYILGFGCHYLLDSRCHPFVNQMADEKVISHTLLEKEFDRTLMLESGKKPLKYRPAKGIHARFSYARVIHRAIYNVNARDILNALRLQKFLTNLMVYGSGRKRKALVILARITRIKLSRDMMEFFMAKDPIPGSEEPVQRLHEYYDDCIRETPGFLEELYSLSYENKPLSERWHMNYNGIIFPSK